MEHYGPTWRHARRTGEAQRGDVTSLLGHLRDIFPDDLAPFLDGLVGPADGRPSICPSTLLDAGMIREILAPAIEATGDVDRRAAISVWSIAYFTTVLPPLLAANILADRAPVVDFEHVRFVIAADRKVAALKVPKEDPGLQAGDPVERFEVLVTRHLAPFIDHVAARSGLTTRVLWSNAGHVFEAFIRRLEAAAAGRRGWADADLLLRTARLSSGSANPLYDPVRYVDGRRLRRVCCMRYLVASWDLCGICPLRLDNPKRVRSVSGSR